jgi:hypothetical protein
VPYKDKVKRLECTRKAGRLFYRRNPEWYINRQNTARYTVMVHYSGSEQPFCKQCGYSDIRALQLDHINNDGYINRRKGIKAGHAFYSWLIKNGFPDTVQVLCANCNHIKEIERRKAQRISTWQATFK